MPRVLHVITGLAVGGAEMALYRLISSQRDGEFTHSVVSLTPAGVVGEWLRDAGIELTTLDVRASPISHFFELLSLMRTSRPDIVQTWLYYADLFGGLAARLGGNRSVIWGIRSSELTAGDSRATIMARHICARLSRRVPHTIVCVAEAARRTHVRVGYDPARMVVVPNGFDLSRLLVTADQKAELRVQCGFGPDDVVVGTLGRFNFSKDQHNFVRAAGLLAQKNKQVRFLMVGRDVDIGNAELMGWIAETGYADRFVLLGERMDVPVCLAVMDIFCLSSRAEAFPNVVGEAMAVGVPCVVTDVGDAALLVADTGKVVPKEDAVLLSKGLGDVLAMTPDERKQLGKKAQARIQNEFSLNLSQKRFENIYRHVIEQGRS